jgi:hypothetical protein
LSAVGRYIQKISLFPFSPQEMWVGWELEGVEGEVPGLIAARGMTASDLANKGIVEFQWIPAKYVGDLELEPSTAKGSAH